MTSGGIMVVKSLRSISPSASRRGSVSFITTVESSVAVIDSHGMALRLAAPPKGVGPASAKSPMPSTRWKLYSMSWAVSSRPFIGALSCQRTPLRMWKV